VAGDDGGPSDDSVVQLRVHLSGVEPAIWRRVLVPGSATMGELSTILATAMGWDNAHLHAFEVAGTSYLSPEELDDDDMDEDKVTILATVRSEPRFDYDYDFGDGWSHEVLVEGVTRSPPGLVSAVCLDGENACPPEDVGGVSGYAEFLRAILDPDDLAHDTYLEWVGGSFDPAAFDVARVNALLQRLA
jgi:hypothetical protein